MRSRAEIAPSRSPIWVAKPAKRNSTSRSAGLRIVSWKASSYSCLSADELGAEEDDVVAGVWAKASPPAARLPQAIRAAHKAARARCGTTPTTHALPPGARPTELLRSVPVPMLGQF